MTGGVVDAGNASSGYYWSGLRLRKRYAPPDDADTCLSSGMATAYVQRHTSRMPMATETADLVSAIADRFSAREDEIVAASSAAAIELVPPLGADAAIMAEVRASYRANIRRFIVVAQHASAPPPIEVPPEALDIARTLVRRGIGIDALFQGYRRGQEVAWKYWMETTSSVVEPGPRLFAVLEASLALLFHYVDDVLSTVIVEAEREREEFLGGAAARQSETARLILNDAPIDTSTASRQLGYELSRRHTAMVLWAEPPGAPQGALESAAGTLALAIGSRRPFTMAAGTSTLWVWIGSDADPNTLTLAHAMAEQESSIRAVVGPTEHGIRGFRRSHEAALVVHRLLMGQPTGDRLTTYADFEVTALAAHDDQRAADFVVATLGPLASDNASAARLRDTLRAYLEEADNAPRAAQRLHTHRNTVLQRVARATDLLGHPVGDRRLAVALALELAHRLGPRVLTSS